MNLTQFREKHGNQATEELLHCILICKMELTNQQWYDFCIKHKIITRRTKGVFPASRSMQLERYGYNEQNNYVQFDPPMMCYRLNICNRSGNYIINLQFYEWELTMR